MSIDTMPAGREMDALVAEKVMGWKWTDFHGIPDKPGEWEDHKFLVDGRGWKRAVHWRTKNLLTWDMHHYLPAAPMPFFSTDIAAAWEVAERMVELGFYWWMASYECGFVLAHVRRKRDRETIADGYGASSTPHSICLAALGAIDHVP